MNQTKTLIVFLIVMAVSVVGKAATTLQFSVTSVNRATGFSDHLGLTGVDGMPYGIVIDTSGNGFRAGNYDLFSNSTSGFLSVGGIVSDDYYYVPSALPVTSTSLSTGTDPGGSGTIFSVANAPNGTDGIIPGVTTNDPFALIWFESAVNANGTYYGMMTDASFLLPSSGSVVAFNGPFTGSTADPIKPANYQFGVVPEPTRAILACFGLVALGLRRRRN